MPEEMSLEDILKRNPHLTREEIERLLRVPKTDVNQARKRTIVPDRLSVGDSSRTRKVRLRYSL
jgi:hypothetical protein